MLAHITPSTEGLRLVFVMPQGMNLAEAQAWMASQLGDDKYDACVKDYARCSFAVPREYVLFVDAEGLFKIRHGLHGLHGFACPCVSIASGWLDDTDFTRTGCFRVIPMGECLVRQRTGSVQSV